MKEPSLSRRKRPKLKLVVSFNGTFHRRPPAGKLRYTGGETRIVSIDRTISFSRLESKIYELLLVNPQKDGTVSFHLKYQLTGTESSEGESHLVSITSDDDVRCMVDEYEKLVFHGKNTRLWVFVCNSSDNGYVDKLVNGDVTVDTVESEDLSNGIVGFVKNNGIEGDKRGACVKRVGEGLSGIKGFETKNLMTYLCGGDKVKKSSDDSLRKMVLKQQLLAKQSDRIRGFGSGFEQSEMEFCSDNKKYDGPLIDLTSGTEIPLSVETKSPSFGGDSYRVNTLDCKSSNTHLMESENFGTLISLPVSDSRPLNAMDGISLVESNGFKHGLSGQSRLLFGNGIGTSAGCLSQLVGAGPAGQYPKPSCYPNINSMINGFVGDYDLKSVEPAYLRNRNRENIMPWGVDCNIERNQFAAVSSSNQFVGSGYQIKFSYGNDRVWSGSNCGIRNHRFGLSDMRNQRIYPYPIKSHRNNLSELGSHRNARIDGRPWIGKFYPGLRSGSNISKQGQTMRSCYTTWGKIWPGFHQQKVEGVERTLSCGLKNQTCSFGNQENTREQSGLGVPQYGKENPKEYPLAYHNACISTCGQSLLPLNAAKNLLSCSRAVNTPIDLLTAPGSRNGEVPCQTLFENLPEMPMNGPTFCDIKGEAYLTGLQEAMNPCNLLHIPASNNGTESGCNSNGVHTQRSVAASLLDLSLHSLSLSSSKKVEPHVHSPPASSDVSEALLKPQSKALDLMDEEHLSSAPQAEKSSGVASDSSGHGAAKMERDNDPKVEVQQDPQSGLSIDEKDDVKKANGGIPSELTAVYTHLAARELQTIKNSDLEYIKELGSGAYGTVFYGKWKGSDVAIKRMKPSCFTEGAGEEDRLVADFWKEAHMLGQLHHPNIVALYGVVTDGPANNLATVAEYMVNGSLKQVLRRKDRTIDRRKRLIIAMDAAFGMEYLHEKRIVHFDLKSHNFLVNMKDPQRPVCKIGDLGLSKIKQRTLVSGGVRGTIPWMAPELLKSKDMVTEKVDVYSFGIAMWELLTGEEPYANMRSKEIIGGIIKGNLRPEIPRWCDPTWRSLMERCWSSDPDARPAFSEIAKELRAMAAAMNIK
ncbi:unnamed protein product [Ilex paraguariensis]|uniref:Protein kinase domain-containing protein n=1 Tax=Ilex paraguariensis TaxID=185542 RepID=A0ABC8QR58_9AQUA